MKKIKEPKNSDSWQSIHNLLIEEKMSDDEMFKHLNSCYETHKRSGGDLDTFLFALMNLKAIITLIARRWGAEGQQPDDTYSVL